jgi:hypothetical protein
LSEPVILSPEMERLAAERLNGGMEFARNLPQFPAGVESARFEFVYGDGQVLQINARPNQCADPPTVMKRGSEA